MTASTSLKWLPSDPQKRRWLAVALVLLVAALLVAIIAIPAVLLHRYYDENIAKLTRQISTQTAFNATRPRLTEKLEMLKARDTRKLFLKGASAALGSAELQETVRLVVEGAGGKVANSSQMTTPPKDDGAYRHIGSTFTLVVNNTNLRRVLYALETKEPYVFVDNIGITANVGNTFKYGPGVLEPELYVTLEAHAYALRATSEAPAGGAAPGEAGSAKPRPGTPPAKGGAI